MKVVHVSVSDLKGGAARAAYRLHQGLRQAGIDSSMVVAEKVGNDDHVSVPLRDTFGYYQRRLHYRQLATPFWRYVPARPTGLGPFTQPHARRNRELVNKLPAVDIINLHWIAHFVDLPTFLAQSQAPLVWTLHDMNAFTGGCHYALDCLGYRQQCGACPQLGSNSGDDMSRKIWLAKEAMYRGVADGKLHFVTPSRWLAEEAGRSSLLRHMPLAVIPNGLDTTLFKPHDKTEARAQLDLPPAAQVVLFTADSISSRRKGLAFLLSALQELQDRTDILLVAVGAGKIKGDMSIPVKTLGHLADERHMALAYSAADLFIIPSLQDNLPLTVMEAMACGTPVVGFEVGGIADLVRPGITGQLVPAKDVALLRQAITALLNDEPRRVAMAQNCRQIAVAEYGLNVQVQRMIHLYRSLLDHKTVPC